MSSHRHQFGPLVTDMRFDSLLIHSSATFTDSLLLRYFCCCLVLYDHPTRPRERRSGFISPHSYCGLFKWGTLEGHERSRNHRVDTFSARRAMEQTERWCNTPTLTIAKLSLMCTGIKGDFMTSVSWSFCDAI